MKSAMVRYGLMGSMSLGLLGCGMPVDDDQPAEPVGVAKDAIVYSDPISVRFMSVAGATCSPVTSSQINDEIAALNKAGGDYGLKFKFYRADYFPLVDDRRDAVIAGTDMPSVWNALGLSVAIRDKITRIVSNQDPPTVYRWCNRTTIDGMPNQVVAWQGCSGGAETKNGGFYNASNGNFVHEMGHGFGLSHSFSISPNCVSWDLVYAARGAGKSNVFFTSRGDCDSWTAANAGKYTMYRMDPNDPNPTGKKGVWANGSLTLSLPRCKSCTGGDLEVYHTGDPQITGYSRTLDSLGSLNAMTYWSNNATFQLDRTPERVHYSASQIEIHQAFAADNDDWLFSQGNPVGIAAPAKSCKYIDPGEGLQRDQPWYSCDGRFRLYLQADGNLVLSQKVNGAFSSVLWATGPLVAGTDTTDIRLVMQGDGNLVVYDSASDPLWHTSTHGNEGAYLALKDDGDLQVRTASRALWRTNTGGH